MEASTWFPPFPRVSREALPAERDYTAWGVALFATLLSVAAYVVTDRIGGVLVYKDAISHLEIARRVIDGTSPGLAQLGNVWLPLPHLLMLPLIWNDTLYHDGFAGSIVSMAAYVGTVLLVYKFTFALTRTKVAGIVAAAVFATNVNVLYMQSTPMTEALLFFMISLTIYCIQQWAHTDKYQYLVAGAVAAFLATLSRYESWPILGCLLVSVIVIAWQRGYSLTPRLRLAGTLDRFIAFAVVATAGIAGWVLWNWVIFGNPLGFQYGPYAKPSLFLTNNEPAIGHWLVAAKTYWYAMSANVTWPMLLLAGIGLVFFIAREWRTKLSAACSLPILSLLVTIPFFVVSLYTGQRPLHVMQIHHDLYDVRFGLLMLIPTAIFVGYLVGSLRWRRPAMYAAMGIVVALAAGMNILLIRQHSVATYNEAMQALATPAAETQFQVDNFLKRRYGGGRILMESFGNELVAFGLPSSELVYEGSYHQWLPALQNPATSHISWIVARCGRKPDKVCRNVTKVSLRDYRLEYRTPVSLRDYRLEYRSPDRVYYVYRLRT